MKKHTILIFLFSILLSTSPLLTAIEEAPAKNNSTNTSSRIKITASGNSYKSNKPK